MFQIKSRKAFRRRRGISMIECLILMVVLGISIWAVMAALVWSMDLQTFSRHDIGSYMYASNWFEALESLPPGTLAASDFNDAVVAVKNLLGTGNAYRIEATRTGPSSGVYTVELKIFSTSSMRPPFVVSRDINEFSNETVPDDKVL